MSGRNDDGVALGHTIGDRYLLIQISRALVNTLMLQDVLAEEKWKASMKPEDWRGLTSLFYQHVNPYGRFTLDLTQRIPLSLTTIA